MRTAIKRTITILIIAALSIGCGVLFDRICDRVERERYPRMYTDSVMKHSADLGIPANVIYAVMKVESNFDSGLKTETGDADRIGLMQLTADIRLRDRYEHRPRIALRAGDQPYDRLLPDIRAL